jgi:hypothetical protein
MKNLLLLLATLFIGLVIGWMAHGLQKPPAKTEDFMKLYPDHIASSALNDMRVATLLSSNDVVMARLLLVRDLDFQAMSLSDLSRKFVLTESNRQALKDAQVYLQAVKK